MTEPVLGIDIGGTGIKGAPVDIEQGALLAERIRVATPSPATPDAVARVVADIARSFEWRGEVGVCFPAAVKRGVTLTATNVDSSWINHDASRTFRLALHTPTTVINDADAAGLAEMRHGAGQGEQGTVIMMTVGTGIGCCLFHRGAMLPNCELGGLKIRGKTAEQRVSDVARLQRGRSWKKWASDMNEYLAYLEQLFLPDLIIVGGGAVKHADQFMHRLHAQARIVPATLGNNAGIIGAALHAAAADRRQRSRTAAAQ